MCEILEFIEKHIEITFDKEDYITTQCLYEKWLEKKTEIKKNVLLRNIIKKLKEKECVNVENSFKVSYIKGITERGIRGIRWEREKKIEPPKEDLAFCSEEEKEKFEKESKESYKSWLSSILETYKTLEKWQEMVKKKPSSYINNYYPLEKALQESETGLKKGLYLFSKTKPGGVSYNNPQNVIYGIVLLMSGELRILKKLEDILKKMENVPSQNVSAEVEKRVVMCRFEEKRYILIKESEIFENKKEEISFEKFLDKYLISCAHTFLTSKCIIESYKKKSGSTEKNLGKRLGKYILKNYCENDIAKLWSVKGRALGYFRGYKGYSINMQMKEEMFK